MITCTPHSTRLGARSALRHALLVGFLFLPGAPSSFAAGASGDTALDREFARAVRPFLNAYCSDCHNAKKHKGNLDLSVYTGVDPVIADYQRWDLLVERLKAAEMPPEDADSHPAPELRRGVIEWYRAFRKRASERTAGDPGPVLPRRLSNAEYDYSIRDLTGVDIRPAREFPVDPANQAGFDNSGESLTMSPALLTKYLEAARRVASHLTLTPDGFDFAPHPMMSDPDRDKYCVKRIVDFYQRQPTGYADYFMAAWRFHHRAELGRARASLSDIAAESHVSPKYLATVWSALTGSREEPGPLSALRRMWSAAPSVRAAGELPADRSAGGQPKSPSSVRAHCERMSGFISRIRKRLSPDVPNLGASGIAPGSQPLVLWKDRELALNHTRPPSDGTLLIPGVAGAGDDTTADELELALRPPTEDALRARFDASLSRFCRVFPDSFYVPERGLIFQKEDKESEGRLLSAGFHLMVGYYRDDAPLRDLILDHGQQLELDRLWEELDFITAAPARQYKDFIFFERAEPPRFMHGAEFDFARSEDQDATSPGKILRLSEAYLTKARRNGGSEAALQAIQSYFTNISAQIRRVESGRLAAEPSHLRSLLRFAERAYRRPLDRTEADELIGFYRGLRGADGLAHEEAIRETVVSVLMSPRFCFPTLGLRSSLGGLAEDGGRWGMGSAKAGVETGARSLSDYELASRLSFFLWSSLPDAALLGHAAKGDLHDPKTLVAQARRMLQDDRSRALAVEFGGNWLDFRGFEEHNGVDRGRFKSFDNELRAAMFEEPVRFFLSVVREDRSVLDLLYGDYTFVNPVLAKHYGAPIAVTNGAAWSRLDNAHQYGRGGLLPMSVFLTKNSPGLRTSPVKRGYWVVRRLLGEIIPPPPPTVPELPADESKLGELTLRDALARHRADKSCAGCHARFDCFGLLFEDYGPTGERRLLDLGGRPVDTKATFPGGGEGVSLDDLRRYIHGRREEEFLENLCRKLLSYGLGRSLILSDDSAVRSMRRKLAAEGNRFSALVESIVTSSQFLNQRARPDVTKN